MDRYVQDERLSQAALPSKVAASRTSPLDHQNLNCLFALICQTPDRDVAMFVCSICSTAHLLQHGVRIAGPYRRRSEVVQNSICNIRCKSFLFMCRPEFKAASSLIVAVCDCEASIWADRVSPMLEMAVLRIQFTRCLADGCGTRHNQENGKDSHA